MPIQATDSCHRRVQRAERTGGRNLSRWACTHRTMPRSVRARAATQLSARKHHPTCVASSLCWCTHPNDDVARATHVADKIPIEHVSLAVAFVVHDQRAVVFLGTADFLCWVHREDFRR